MTKLGSVTLLDSSAARTPERVVNAAMGLPRWGEGIPFGHGPHVPRKETLDWKWTESQKIATTGHIPITKQHVTL